MSGGVLGRAVVMTPSGEDVAFLVYAVRELEKSFRRDGVPVPPGVSQLVSHLSSGVTRGQAGSTSAEPLRVEQVSPMTPRLITYETAAELLAISVSTLKRRIAAGDLHPISVGGSSRIRVVELDAFVAAQVAEVRAG